MSVPAPYNLTAGFGNTTGIVGLTQSVNSVLMNGYLGVMILASIFIVSYMGFIKSTGGDSKTSFTSSSFLVFVFSLMLRALTLVNDWTVYVCIGIFAISAALSWK